jgi:hypothetical protein
MQHTRSHDVPSARRTRRQLLAGATGALAAVLAAETLGRPSPAAAVDGNNVVLGAGNFEENHTDIRNTTFGDSALDGSASGGVGVQGLVDTGGSGVEGDSFDNGNGVAGLSASGRGVYGQSGGTATSYGGISNGVHGITDSVGGVGVLGENVAGGTAVGGLATAGDGVGGTSASGNGVHGVSGAAGIGVLAENSGGGTALKVSGKAAFSRSGVVTVGAGKASATKTGVALASASFVLATLQEDHAGVWVRSVVPNVAARSFTVHLSEAAPARTRVAWFVIN